MNIGTFTKKSDGKYTGRIEIAFPKISCEATFQPVAQKPNEFAPDYRLFSGRAELGAAWTEQHDNVEGDFLSVKLDAPGLPAPINCALFKDTEGDGYRLVWERPEADEQ